MEAVSLLECSTSVHRCYQVLFNVVAEVSLICTTFVGRLQPWAIPVQEYIHFLCLLDISSQSVQINLRLCSTFEMLNDKDIKHLRHWLGFKLPQSGLAFKRLLKASDTD